MNDQILSLCLDAMGILIPALCVVAVELLRRKLGLEKMKKVQTELETKQTLAVLAVKFVEQAYADLKGREKYNQAAAWMAARAKEKGINVTAEEVQGLVEAALRTAKDAFGEQWANAVAGEEEDG